MCKHARTAVVGSVNAFSNNPSPTLTAPAGVHELTVTTMWASNGGTPSLAPDAPVTQQQQLAAVEAQLPALSCGSHGSYGHAAGQHTLGGNTAAAGGGVSASQVVARSPTQDASQQQQLQQQPTGGSSVSIGSDRGATQQGGVASSGESPPEDTCGVLFLSNTMGSVAYVVTSDSAVYLKRGERGAARVCVVNESHQCSWCGGGCVCVCLCGRLRVSAGRA